MSDDKKESENESNKPSVVVAIDKNQHEDKQKASDELQSVSEESQPDSAENRPVSDEERSVNEENHLISEEEQSFNEKIAQSENNQAKLESEKSVDEKNQQTIGISEFFAAQQAPRLETPQSYRKNRWLPITAGLLSISALVAVAWASYSLVKMNQDWQILQADLKQQITQQNELNQTANQVAQSSLQASNSSQQAINQQALLVDQLSQALTINQQRVKDLSGRQKQDWLLAEAEYLIKLAQHKITLEKDKLTAIALLKTADQRILETGDNSLLELRQQIALDITDLQLVSTPDLSGISSQLNAISNQIPSLSLIALEFEPIDIRNKQSLFDENAEFSWSNVYDNFITEFVTIKDHSQPVKPLMTVNQRANLNSNIQLALQQAQIAVIRAEQGLYEVNLTNAINWIGEFFKHDQTSQTLLENLTQLSQLKIEIELPQDIKAKQSIQAINQQRLYQWLETNKQPAIKNDKPEITGDSL